eukprot:754655-Hanusia_phi.AAC.4
MWAEGEARPLVLPVGLGRTHRFELEGPYPLQGWAKRGTPRENEHKRDLHKGGWYTDISGVGAEHALPCPLRSLRCAWCNPHGVLGGREAREERTTGRGERGREEQGCEGRGCVRKHGQCGCADKDVVLSEGQA